tara:strand:- start:909 stop:1256 length:348 start_codon:yes stop_codon:yes gene_type:complete
MQNFGKTRKVSTKYQGRIGAPPPPSAEAQASAARYEGSAKQRRDLAVQAAKAGERPRSTGRVKRQTFTPPVPTPGGGGGGGGAPAVAEEQDWWMNPWVWAVAVGVLLVASKRRKK